MCLNWTKNSVGRRWFKKGGADKESPEKARIQYRVQIYQFLVLKFLPMNFESICVTEYIKGNTDTIKRPLFSNELLK